VEGGYIRIAIRRWPAVVVCLIVGVGASYGITHGIAKSYQANSQVFINVLGGNSISGALDAAQLSSQLIQSYAYVAESSSVATQVQSDLALGSAPSISATAVPGTLLISMSSTEPSPALAQSVLASAMKVFAVALKSYQSGNGASVIVRTVQPASASPDPISPKRSDNLIYGGASGLVVGLVLAWLLELFDRSFRDPSDLEGFDVGPLLGRIPRLKGVRGFDIVLDGTTDADGMEAYTALAASLRFVDPGRPVKTILFTSPGESDGKTTTVANLLGALVHAGEQTIGVDLNLRNPKLAAAYGITSGPGLTSVVIGAEPVGRALRWSGGLGILPPGTLPPNPSEIVASEPTAILLSELSERTDRVLVDAPGVMTASDPLTLAPLVDGVVLVLRPGTTKRSDIAEACRRLDLVGARIIGHVINVSTSRSAGQLPSTQRRGSEHHLHTADLQLLAGGSGRSA
jgi:polysaccharide biosynthesis transport protein